MVPSSRLHTTWNLSRNISVTAVWDTDCLLFVGVYLGYWGIQTPAPCRLPTLPAVVPPPKTIVKIEREIHSLQMHGNRPIFQFSTFGSTSNRGQRLSLVCRNKTDVRLRDGATPTTPIVVRLNVHGALLEPNRTPLTKEGSHANTTPAPNSKRAAPTPSKVERVPLGSREQYSTHNSVDGISQEHFNSSKKAFPAYLSTRRLVLPTPTNQMLSTLGSCTWGT